MKFPQLSLRDLFWLVLVVGLSLGWWVHSSRLQLERDQALTERGMIDVIDCEAMPWIVAATELDRFCRRDFNAAYMNYENAPPNIKEQMAKEALQRMGNMKPLPE